MPLPKPKNKEKKSEFVSRCIGDTQSNKDFPDQKQRIAVCYAQWDKAKKDAQVVAGEGMDEFLYSAEKTYDGNKYLPASEINIEIDIDNGAEAEDEEECEYCCNDCSYEWSGEECDVKCCPKCGSTNCSEMSDEQSMEEQMTNEQSMTEATNNSEMQNSEIEKANAAEDYNNLEMLAVQFRSAQLYTHNAHHLTKGPTFFADHEFLGELYESYTEAYDQLIEIILSDSVKLNLVNVQTASASKLSEIQGENYFNTLIELELAVQSKVELLAAETGISQGVLNLIAGFAQDSKSRVYKLRARVS
jgi:DNA-binding ferritin-like protein